MLLVLPAFCFLLAYALKCTRDSVLAYRIGQPATASFEAGCALGGVHSAISLWSLVP